MKKRRRNWPLCLLELALTLVAVIYVVAWPLGERLAMMRVAQSGAFAVPLPPLHEQLMMRFFELFILTWLFMFGASIGSFLNVVIYRVPRGISLLGSSRCPFCFCDIRPYDNLPVFGWLNLRGRCRDCHLPISVRYPLVETSVGLIFLGLGVLEVLLQGVNLPGESGNFHFSVSWMVGRTRWDLVGIYACHSVLLSILFSWVWISYDRRRVPWAYMLFAMGLAIVSAALLPSVMPVAHGLTLPVWLTQSPRLDAILSYLTGAAAGCLLGAVLAWKVPGADRELSPARGAWASLTLVGGCLGWQAVLSIAVVATSTRLLAVAAWRLLGVSFGRLLVAHLFAATVFQLAVWRWLEQLPWWPNSHVGPTVMAVFAVLALLFASVARWIDENDATA